MSTESQVQGLRERKNEERRQAITRAALELALEVGFERATVAQIAARADVSPRTVHAWFPAKEDIVVGGSNVRVDRLAAALEDAGGGDVLERIRAWLSDVGFDRSGPRELERLRYRVLLADPHLRALQRSRHEEVERLIAAAIARDNDLPEDAVAPQALAAAIVATLLAMQERFAANRRDYRDEFDGTWEMLRAALRALKQQR